VNPSANRRFSVGQLDFEIEGLGPLKPDDGKPLVREKWLSTEEDLLGGKTLRPNDEAPETWGRHRKAEVAFRFDLGGSRDACYVLAGF
jgi:hypothetical protein